MYNDYFKQLKDSFNTIYDHLYNTDDYTSEDVEKGEKITKEKCAAGDSMQSR